MSKKLGEVASSPIAAPWVMSPEVIIRELHTLSDELDLTPPQLAAVLQTTEDQLKTMREKGDGPDFEKLGEAKNAPVRYRLGVVRKWRMDRTFTNTASVRVSRFSGLPDFLSSGAIDDCYVAARDSSGNLWDFWESVRREADVVEVVWQPMGELLEGFRQNGARRLSVRSAKEFEDFLPPAPPGNPPPPPL